jgi:hypothetical protein
MADTNPFAGGVELDNPFAEGVELEDEDTGADLESAPVEDDLPIPTTDMWEGKSEEEVKELYQRYMESPDTTKREGAMRYMPFSYDFFEKDGVQYRIPAPSKNIFSEGYDTATTDKIYGGLTNAITNVAELGAAGIDKLTGDEEASATKAVQANLPRMSAGDSMGDQLILGAGEVGTGLLTGSAIVSGISKLPKLASAGAVLGPYVTNVAKGLGKLIGYEAGMTATVGSDSGTLLVGDDALFKSDLLSVLNIPEDANEAEQVLAKRGNTLADALILAGPLTTAAKGVGYTAGFAKAVIVDPLLGVASKTKVENEIVNNILDRLASVTKASTEEEIEQVKKDLVDVIRNNPELVVEIGEKNLDEVAVQFDTMTALQQGLDVGEETQRRVSSTASAVRKQGLSKNLDNLQDATESPSRQLEETMTTLAGEGENVQTSVKGLTEQGMEPVRSLAEQAQEASARLTELETDLPRLIAENPELGAKIDALSNTSGINIYSGPQTKITEITAGVRGAYATMKAKKDELFSAIEGGELSPEIVQSMFADMSEDQLKAFRNAMPPNSPALKLFSTIKPIQVPDLDANGVAKLAEDGSPITRKETPEETEARIAEFLANEGVDFAYIYRNVRPALAEAANRLFGKGESANSYAGDMTRESIRYIDGPLLDWVEDNSDEATAEAARVAKNYYEEEFAPFWKDGPLGEIADLYDGTVGRTSQRMMDKDLEFKPVTFKQGSRDTLTGIMTDTQLDSAGQLIDLLKSGNSTVGPQAVTDYLLGTTLADVAKLVRTEGTSAVDADVFEQSLANYSTILRENFPEELERLNSFIETVRKAKSTIGDQRIVADTLAEKADTMLKTVRLGALKGFLEETGEPIYRGADAFDQLFQEGAKNTRQVTELVSMARQNPDPLVLEGMKEAYQERLLPMVLGETREAAGSRAIKLGTTGKMLDTNLSRMMEYGDILYQDNPQAMEGIRSIMRVTQGVAQGKRGRAIAGSSDTAYALQAQKTMDRLVLALIGPLTRTGARIRSATGTVLSTISPDQAAVRIMDNVLSDPEEFVRIADRMMKEPMISSETAKTLFAYGVRVGIYSQDDEEGFMGTLRSAASIEKQMRGAFQEDTDTIDEEMRSLFFAE